MAKIKRIGIKQTAKFATVFYFLISFVFILPIFLITLLVGGLGEAQDALPLGGTVFGGVLLLLLPVLYALLGGIMVAIGSVLYNLVAKITGGIEVEIDSPEQMPSAPGSQFPAQPPQAPPGSQPETSTPL